jgi:hypothetical protein
MAAINGPMIACSKGTGKTTKCTETVFSLGQMADLTRELILMIKRRVKVLLPGLTVVGTLVRG